MKKILILSFLIVTTVLQSMSQPPQGFSYQAAIRDAENNIVANTTVIAKVGILKNSATGEQVYEEQHSVTTNAQGVISLMVGFGTNAVGTFSEIDWSGGLMFVKLSVDFGSGFIALGTTQILSVPYALYSGNGIENVAGTEGQTLVHTGSKWQASGQIMANETVTINAIPGRNPNDAIFAVRNSVGDTVFAVYETGVKVFINDDTSEAAASKGGFAVGGLSRDKNGEMVEYFKVTPDSSFVQFRNDVGKASKGGFAVGGLSRDKQTKATYFSLTPELTFINFDVEQAAASKGGFAVGGLSKDKAISTDYLILNNDSIRMYINTEDAAASKGGFAVGGLSRAKDNPIQNYFSVEPHYIEFRFDEDDVTKASKGGFAVGGLSRSKNNILKDYFSVQSDNIVIAINENDSKGGKGIFKVGTLDGNGDNITDLLTVDKDSTIITNSIYSAGDLNVGGNINAGGTIGSTVKIGGIEYQTVLIGSQTWMKTNLKSKKLADGTDISPDLYVGNGDIDLYGYLYYSKILSFSGRVCPEGWRIPTSADWNTLIETVKRQYPNDPTSLLATGHWMETSNTTNYSEFGALPGGRATQVGGDDQIHDDGLKGYYWINNAAAEVDQAVVFPQSNTNINIYTGNEDISNGFFIRCVK